MVFFFLLKIVRSRKGFSLISSRDHCKIFSSLRISETMQAGFEPVQNLCPIAQ